VPKTLICIVGPTAIGKTTLAIDIAKQISTEIISSDSRQFYKEMTIGTAKPSLEEMKEIPHHFIDNLSIHDNYSVGNFERDALLKIDELFDKKNEIIMVGGSGLYEKAVTEGLDNFPEVDSQIRVDLKSILENEGVESLQNLLKEKDPKYYSEVDIFNTQRIIRALEICIGTGKTFSSFRQNKISERNFSILKIGLIADREIMYSRINQRVEIMFENGFLNEAEKLFPYKNLNALNTVGYKELFAYFEGKYSLEFAKEEIKKNTRRFAKRQLTWYNKDTSIHWFNINNVSKIKDFIAKTILK